MRLWHTALIKVLPREQLVAQWREIYTERLAKRSPNYEADASGTMERARRAMNSFYRLAGFNIRLFEIENDRRIYNARRVERMQERADKWIRRVSDYLKEFNADICYPGLYPCVIDIVKTESGGVYDLFLTCWYE